MPGQPFQSAAHIQQLMNSGIRFVELSQIGVKGKCAVKCNIQFVRNRFCKLIRVTVRQIHDTCNITDHTFGGKRSESDDLYYFVRTIFACDIIDYILAMCVFEINVNIRHGYTFRIQETFEEQIILNRINVGDVHTIGSNTAGGRTPSRAYCNVVFTAIIDVIPYDQEIIHVPHFPNNGQFVIQFFAQCTVIVRIAFFQSIGAELIQIGPGIIPLWYIEEREFCDTEFDLHMASVGNFLRIIDGILRICKKRTHFSLTLYIILPAFIAEPVCIRYFLLRLNAQQKVMCFCIVGSGVMTVIGSNKAYIKFFGHAKQCGIHICLRRNSVILKFEKEISVTKTVVIALCNTDSLVIISARNCFRNLPCKAGRETDDAFMILAQNLHIDTRFIIISFCKTAADNM